MIGKILKKQIILLFQSMERAGIGLVDGFRRIIPTAKIDYIEWLGTRKLNSRRVLC